MSILKYLSVSFLFFVITINAYSQKDSNELRNTTNHSIFSKDTLFFGGTEYYKNIMSDIFFFYDNPTSSNYREYSILSYDGKNIIHRTINVCNEDLYNEYNPNRKCGNEMCSILKTKTKKKIYYWVAEKLKKGSKVSINNAHKKNTYICKSFNQN